MRTLVVSDLHLGAGRGRAVLAAAEPRAALARAIAGAERLVLLGDVLELRERPLRDALAAASRVLPELVGGMAPGSELILVPGNHDHELTRIGEARSAMVAMLSGAGARVSVEYPGVWLREDVYAMHGHYLDRHTTTPALERLGIGLMARLRSQPLSAVSRPEDYERVQAPIYAWLRALAETEPASRDGEPEALPGPHAPGGSSAVLRRLRLGRGLDTRILDLGIRLAAGVLSTAGLGPLSGDLSGPQLRRAALRAYADVLVALDLRPAYALFGHTHRAGPLPADRCSEWIAPGAIRLINCGSWVTEPAFVGAERGRSPYRPGFAVWLEESGSPELVNLLRPA